MWVTNYKNTDIACVLDEWEYTSCRSRAGFQDMKARHISVPMFDDEVIHQWPTVMKNLYKMYGQVVIAVDGL